MVKWGPGRCTRPPFCARWVPSRGRSRTPRDRKSTRLNSSHSQISYAVFCLKKKINADHARKPRRVDLDPCRGVVHIAVLPCPEPQQNNMQLVLACSLHNLINVGPIELTRLR